jgi:hypothetical protein
MGQQITVAVREGIDPTTRIFDLNRSLTGMGIERYRSVSDVRHGRPPDVLAKRLFRLGAGRSRCSSPWCDRRSALVERNRRWSGDEMFGYQRRRRGRPAPPRAGFEPLPA